nr:MAG TPA: hypothetical protein [Bacteriophage sp.]
MLQKRVAYAILVSSQITSIRHSPEPELLRNQGSCPVASCTIFWRTGVHGSIIVQLVKKVKYQSQ